MTVSLMRRQSACSRIIESGFQNTSSCTHIAQKCISYTSFSPVCLATWYIHSSSVTNLSWLGSKWTSWEHCARAGNEPWMGNNHTFIPTWEQFSIPSPPTSMFFLGGNQDIQMKTSANMERACERPTAVRWQCCRLLIHPQSSAYFFECQSA